MRLLLCAVIFCVSWASAADPEPPPLRGVVLDAQTGRPLQGALVRVSGSSHPSVSTTSSGSFTIPVPAPECSLMVQLAGYSLAMVSGNGTPDSLLEIPLVPVLYSMDEVLVQASRIRLDVSHAPVPVNIIDRWEIENAPAMTLAGILGTAPGLFVKDYGGGSGLKSLSQRGLGAEHTAILLNGLPVNSAQNGIVDLGMTSLENLERIEVLHGGSSLSFGSQAVGGVVNLVSRAPASEPAVRAGLTLGSYGYERYSISGGTNLQAGAFRISYLQEGAEDDYRFIYHNGPESRELRRTNSDFLSRSLTFRGAIAAGGSTVADAYATAISSERGVAGVVVSPSSAGVARQSDSDFLLQLGVRHSLGKHDLLELRAQGRNASQQYSDPSIVVAGIPLDNQYRNRELRLEPRYEGQTGEWLQYAAGGTAALSSASGSITDGTVQRTDWGIYAQARASEASPFDALEEAYITGGLRYDRSGSVSAASPSIGVGLRSMQFHAGPLTRAAFSVRGAVSRSFRAPTFNELYYQGGGGRGNPELLPEHGTGIEGGGTFAFVFGGDHAFDAAFFHNAVDDRIVWSPASAGTVMPRNLRRVEVDGYELSYSLDLFARTVRTRVYYGSARSINASAAYPGDPLVGTSLVYVPRETAGATLSFVHRPASGPFTSVGGTLWYTITGPRYMSEDNLDVFPTYDVLDLSLALGVPVLGVHVSARCEVNNILNEDYQTIRGYPMPLRTFRIGLAVEY
jgi:vitamin B12 transporter